MGPDIGPIMEKQGKKPAAVRRLIGYGKYKGRSKKKDNSIDVLIYIY